jgi:hypothetical protein
MPLGPGGNACRDDLNQIAEGIFPGDVARIQEDSHADINLDSAIDLSGCRDGPPRLETFRDREYGDLKGFSNI